MRILVLGGNGMLGHHFLQSWQRRHDVKVTLRDDSSRYSDSRLFDETSCYFEIDVRDLAKLSRTIEHFRPDAVINATGVNKQIAGVGNIEQVIEVNALFPHKLARICETAKARLIQFSSDCIFSGKQGRYVETDESDAVDVYGKTKFLGEVDQAHVVTLRKSTIGLELGGKHGLVEWFLAQHGPIKGFRKAIYSGLISSELVRVVEMILLRQPDLSGVWNVASTAISKYDLLTQLQSRLDMQKADIIMDDSFVCDRSLDGTRFELKTAYKAPDWDSMLDELALEISNRSLL